MRTMEELYAFAEGYQRALQAEREFMSADVSAMDDWVVWGGYDINFAGRDYSTNVSKPFALAVDAYRAGWKDDIGNPLYSFIIEGESK